MSADYLGQHAPIGNRHRRYQGDVKRPNRRCRSCKSLAIVVVKSANRKVRSLLESRYSLPCLAGS